MKINIAKPMPEPGIFFEGGADMRKNWLPAHFLSDDEYVRALEAFPRVCTDILAINLETKSFLLPKRKHQAALGVWIFGGGQKMGETPREAAARIMKRECGTELLPEDFDFLSLSVTFWTHRNPVPQERGEHDIVFTYVFAPTKEELGVISESLDPEEYDTSFGVRAHTLKDLEALSEPQKEKLVEYWHRVFG